MKIIDNKYRKIIKYHLYLIKEEMEWIEGLEKYDIDNDELDEHYSMAIEFMADCNKKLKELGYGQEN